MNINLISGYMVENSTVGIDSIRIERHLAEIGGRKQPGRIRHDHVLDSLCTVRTMTSFKLEDRTYEDFPPSPKH